MPSVVPRKRRRRDRHGRYRRARVDPRRRPIDGFRTLSTSRFERMVGAAFDALPSALASRLDNVQITIADVPFADPAGDGNEILLGLYEGVPQTEREFGMAALPDRITIFRRSIEMRATSARDVHDIVHDTVIHEIAHHFGIDDDRLDELGWA